MNDLSEMTRRMAYRVRGLDPLGRTERRRERIHRYVKLYKYEKMAEPEGRIRAAIEVLIASLWVTRHPETGRPLLVGEVCERWI